MSAPEPRKRPEKEMLRGEATRRRIKLAARKLFAIRGLDVPIRDIVKTAKQKNSGSISYYFHSKDNLIKELIFDTANLLDEEHNRRLDEAESAGGPSCIRDVVDILIHSPTIDSPGKVKDDYGLRFLNMAMINHRDLVFEALPRAFVRKREDSSYCKGTTLSQKSAWFWIKHTKHTIIFYPVCEDTRELMGSFRELLPSGVTLRVREPLKIAEL